jgi:hypothetical protein
VNAARNTFTNGRHVPVERMQELAVKLVKTNMIQCNEDNAIKFNEAKNNI